MAVNHTPRLELVHEVLSRSQEIVEILDLSKQMSAPLDLKNQRIMFEGSKDIIQTMAYMIRKLTEENADLIDLVDRIANEFEDES